MGDKRAIQELLLRIDQLEELREDLEEAGVRSIEELDARIEELERQLEELSGDGDLDDERA